MTEETKNPLEPKDADGEGVPLEQMSSALIEAMSSRRWLLGAVMGAFAGSAPAMLARPAHAAPTDVKGSPNIAVKSYTNRAGNFVLWADGHISNANTGVKVVTPGTGYGPAAGFTPSPKTPRRPGGSPSVAVDVIQDTTGTYVLFSDGSVRHPPVANAGAPGFGTTEIFYGKTFGGGIASHSPNLTVSGTTVRFRTAFKEPPFVFLLYKNGDWFFMYNGTVGFTNPTNTAITFNPGHLTDGGFFGMGFH